MWLLQLCPTYTARMNLVLVVYILLSVYRRHRNFNDITLPMSHMYIEALRVVAGNNLLATDVLG